MYIISEPGKARTWEKQTSGQCGNTQQAPGQPSRSTECLPDRRGIYRKCFPPAILLELPPDQETLTSVVLNVFTLNLCTRIADKAKRDKPH